MTERNVVPEASIMPVCALGASVAIQELPAFRSCQKMFVFLEEEMGKDPGNWRDSILCVFKYIKCAALAGLPVTLL